MRALSVATGALFAASLLVASDAAMCSGHPTNGTKNNYAINAADAPTLMRSAANGQAYRAGQPGFEFWVLHLYGTPYEQGFAHATMMKAEVLEMLNRTWAYMEAQMDDDITGLPDWLRDLIEEIGLTLAMDFFIAETKNYTTPYIWQEMQARVECGVLALW